jgi:CheY-like chemotaxis protein
VSIYSEPGLGTTVRLYLPVAGSTAVDPGVSRAVAEPAAQQESVLVVEDDSFVRGYAVAALENLGYRVLVAEDGRAALEQLASGARPDVLFTDIVMPGGVNGWELAERAVALRPGLKVLFTSGYALESLAARGRLPTAAVVLHKPYRKAELAERLQLLLGGGG